MLTVSNLSVQFGKRVLFDEVTPLLPKEIAMESLELMVPENRLS